MPCGNSTCNGSECEEMPWRMRMVQTNRNARLHCLKIRMAQLRLANRALLVLYISIFPTRSASPSAKVGLGLSYALTITRTLSFGVRSSTALENQFNSVERVQEFITLKQEVEQEVFNIAIMQCFLDAVSLS